MMTWYTEFRCVSCDEILSFAQRMHCMCRCPYCGYKGPSAFTRVDTIEVAYQLEVIAPWRAFWKSRTRRIYKVE